MDDLSTTPPRSPARAPTRREFGSVNWMGLRTLYAKEVRRFLRIFPQTLLAPIITNLLYMTVFTLAFSERAGDDPGTFIAFLAPGLVMLGILGNAAGNSSSSIMTAKMTGAIQDVLMPPLDHRELAVGYVGGAMTRGVVVAVATAIGLSLFTLLIPVVPWAVVYFGLSAAAMLGMIGVLSGIWAEKFDQLAVVNQFVILPLSFLSGTFYHIDVLPPVFQTITRANPLFYLIDGFRYGFLAEADSNVAVGVVYIAAINIVLAVIVLRVLKSGWKLKS